MEVTRTSSGSPTTLDHTAMVDTHVEGYTIPKGTIVSRIQGLSMGWEVHKGWLTNSSFFLAATVVLFPK